MTPPSIDHPLSMSAGEAALCFSELANEPDLAELIELFVSELPGRLAAIDQAAQASDRQEVGRLTHQLKGASGSYGFPGLARAVATVERAARGGSDAEFSAALIGLAATGALIRAGRPARG